MWRRVIREGYVLQTCLSICTSLVSEMYMPAVGDKQRHRRYRLRCNTSTIEDFGICFSSIDVKGQERLAYLLPNGEICKGQGPDNHYWMYFRTTRGKEYILDCAMFPFNLGIKIGTEPYLNTISSFLLPEAPAYFEGRSTQMPRNGTHRDPLHHKKRRFCIRRDG